MVKKHALMDRNTLHASTPATGMATLCSSSTAPVQDTTLLAYSDVVPQPQRVQLPRPQLRSGVPVYVMLPLDTVSFLLVPFELKTWLFGPARTALSCR